MASAEHRIPRIAVKPDPPLKDPLVFISYSSKDELVADKVCRGLEVRQPAKADMANRSIEIQMPQGFKRKLPH